MSTLTTADEYKAAIARMKAYVSDAGASINTLCGDRVYVRRAPDDCALPYGVIKRVRAETDPDDGNLREEYDLEMQWFGRTQQEAELLADLSENALLTWHESSAVLGLSYGIAVTDRTTPDTDPDALNSQLNEARSTVRCGGWPRRLSDALT